MNITVLGLGYVGCVSAACLAQQGHRVFGVDVKALKVDLINQGHSPIVEKSIGDIIHQVVSDGQLTATTDAVSAIVQSEISLICVGTPSEPNGSLDIQYVHNASRDVGRALRESKNYHVVVVRSTVLPGTTESVVIPAVEGESGKRVGQDFGVCTSPEFMREGSAVEDYYHPAFTLIGARDQRSAELVEAMYKQVNAPVIKSDIRTAEMVKYVSNAFHALKVSFANEIGVLCKGLDIDSHKVMDVFARDTQLNISPKYLRPGFAFGGSCLPKDIRAVLHRAKSLDLDLPVLSAILPSNDRQIEHAYQMIQRTNQKKIGILGLSFKAGTDDLRESPMVRLVERLLGKGYDLLIYDKDVSMATLIGANKEYIEQVIPHISSLIVSDMGEVLTHADVLVIGHNAPEFRDVLGHKQQVIDLVRIEKDLSDLDRTRYQGICW
jgi:GDP-mannose 6-dehydrogenase